MAEKLNHILCHSFRLTGNSLLPNHINKNDTSSLPKSFKNAEPYCWSPYVALFVFFSIQTFWSQELPFIIQHEAQTALHSPSVQVNIYTYLYISDLLIREILKYCTKVNIYTLNSAVSRM
ncbi:vitamin K-dependent protein C [Platysternon megacephalum]|uniref:Vitamin K-dependent protein C n=1 Tax=Platysternon megacephalum TaxID=55544 RepID=A0A4D9ELQ6_9SAUR|nr:vitamin K-dependent protein C [Platysternon megacephalum]